MPYFVELTGQDPLDSTVKTRVFAMGVGAAFSDSVYASSGLMRWSSPTQKIDVTREGGVVLSGDAGRIEINNTPRSVSTAGPLDALAKWAWYGRRANLYWIASGGSWASRTLVATGILQQPVANLAIDGDVRSTLMFPLRDPRSVLDVPLQPSKFAGTNTGGAGVEGGEDLKGKPKPIAYGTGSNIPGVLVNPQKLIYMLADKAVTVHCVRDGGCGLVASTSRANTASLEANSPTPGTYDYCSISTGTYVRLGGPPIGRISFDFKEGANDAARTHAQVWSRVRQERCGNVSGDLVAASITAVDALDGNEVGFWWAEEMQQLDAVNQILTSLSGYEVEGFDGKWTLAKLVAPSGATVYDLVVLDPTTEMTAKMRPLRNINKARPNFAPDGSPPYKVNVNWGRNYTVMGPTEFLGVASDRIKDKFSKEWRTETATNTAIWNPTTGVGPYPKAPELTINTGYQPGVDGRTCPHAATEAAARLALYSAMPGQYEVSFSPEVGDRLLPGDVVSVKHAQMELTAGPSFRVLQAGWTVEREVAEAKLIVGFQT